MPDREGQGNEGATLSAGTGRSTSDIPCGLSSWGDSNPGRVVTPTKLCIASLIRDYIFHYSPQGSLQMNSKSTLPSLTPKERTSISLLLLHLIQGPNLHCKDLIYELEQGEYALPNNLLNEWKRTLALTIVNGIGGLIDLKISIEGYFLDQSNQAIHRSSVVGLFLKKIVLYFDMLAFSEVSQLFENFKDYYNSGMDETKESETDLDSSFLSSEVAIINYPGDFERSMDDQYHDLAQAELYIARQVELLQCVEFEADSPEEIQATICRILRRNPNLSAAHLLSYLNCLRVNEYTGAINSLKMAFGPVIDPNSQQSQEDVNKCFRYAALNLSSLHARFGHDKEALSALKESIMLAQEAGDQVCLQHALSWLYRIQVKSQSNKQTVIERCIAKSGDLSLSYLTSLGIQSLNQIAIKVPTKPSSVMEVLAKSDILNCQHSIIELIANSYAQKAAFWTTYGRSRLSCTVSQLLLTLDTSEPTREGFYVIAEAYAIALCNVARYLFDHGYGKYSDKVIGLAKRLFKKSSYSKVWQMTELNIEFQRSLYRTNWVQSERLISNIGAVDSLEPLFLKFQLYLERGDPSMAFIVQQDLFDYHSKNPLCPSDHVRFLILQGDLFCLVANYSNAITPLMEARSLCKQFHFELLLALVSLHLAHIQLQLKMYTKSVQLVEQHLSTVLSHATLYDSSRAYLLMAKCQIVSSSSSDKRSNMYTAIKYLKLALEGFKTIQSYQRIKDVLYILARLYHVLNLYQERNQVSAEFKKLDEQHPTNACSKLANML